MSLEISEVYMPNLRGKERGQQVRSVCLVRNFTEICMWAIRCVVTWLDCTSRGWGYLPLPPKLRSEIKNKRDFRHISTQLHQQGLLIK
jgi:hypothetical protein